MRAYRDEVLWQVPLALLTMLAVLSASVAAPDRLDATLSIILGYASGILLFVPIVALAAYMAFIGLCAVRREPAPWAATGHSLRRRWSSPGLMISIVPILIMTSMLMGAFGATKIMIPLINPFYLDDRLAAADRMLFGGYPAWEWTHAMFGSVSATAALDLIYTAWVPSIFVALIIAAVASRLQRAQFFLTFAAAWVLLGMVGAWLLSSAGPCYSPLIDTASQTDFVPLLARLERINAVVELNALGWQKELWQARAEQRFGIGVGISAMPSMHNAMTALYVAALWRKGSVSRYASLLFALLIFIGSIHLGWHYAVDGLVSFTVVIALWHAAGRYLRWSGYARTVNRVSLVQQPA